MRAIRKFGKFGWQATLTSGPRADRVGSVRCSRSTGPLRSPGRSRKCTFFVPFVQRHRFFSHLLFQRREGENKGKQASEATHTLNNTSMPGVERKLVLQPALRTPSRVEGVDRGRAAPGCQMSFPRQVLEICELKQLDSRSERLNIGILTCLFASSAPVALSVNSSPGCPRE